MAELKNYDYYQHVVPSKKDIKGTNYKIDTFYISSKDRDIQKYPNKYNFTATLPYTFNDISMIELVRGYFDYNSEESQIKDNYTKKFYNFSIQFLIHEKHCSFDMRLGNNSDISNNNDTYNWRTERILELFNKMYNLTIDLHIDIKISNMSNDKSINYEKPIFVLKYDNDYELYYFQCLFKSNFINNSISLHQETHFEKWFKENDLHDMYHFVVEKYNIDSYELLETYDYTELGKLMEKDVDHVKIKKLINKIKETKEKENYDKSHIGYNFFGLDVDKENNFLSILGFNDNNYKKNSLYVNTVSVNVIKSQYICTNIEVVGATLLYRDGTVEIVNHEYSKKVNIEENKLTVISSYNNGKFRLESLTNNIVDYKINVKTKKITQDLISIKIIKSSNRYLYYQILSCLLSNDTDNGIRINFIKNDLKLGNIILENFKNTTNHHIECLYDLTYFKNIDHVIVGKKYDLKLGFKGFKQEDDELIIYWNIISTNYDIDFKNYKGGNRYYPPPLSLEYYHLKRIIIDLKDIFNIIDSSKNKKQIHLIKHNDDKRINYWSYIDIIDSDYGNKKIQINYTHKISYNCYFFENNFDNVLIEMNFMFSGFYAKDNSKKLDTNGLSKFLVLDIDELNNKYSNNSALNKCFLELPINRSNALHFESTESNSIVYFNPIRRELDKLTIKLRDLAGNILPDHYGSDYILVFNLKQINNSGTLYGI